MIASPKVTSSKHLSSVSSVDSSLSPSGSQLPHSIPQTGVAMPQPRRRSSSGYLSASEAGRRGLHSPREPSAVTGPNTHPQGQGGWDPGAGQVGVRCLARQVSCWTHPLDCWSGFRQGLVGGMGEASRAGKASSNANFMLQAWLDVVLVRNKTAARKMVASHLVLLAGHAHAHVVLSHHERNCLRRLYIRANHRSHSQSCPR